MAQMSASHSKVTRVLMRNFVEQEKEPFMSWTCFRDLEVAVPKSYID